MNRKDGKIFDIRLAQEADIPFILNMIHALAQYEKMDDQVVATPELLAEWLFRKQTAQALIGEEDGRPVAFALFFYNFSTFLGRAGIYLEDLFVLPEMRGRGYGRALLARLASIAKKSGCGRLEWCCLDWNRPSIDFYLSLDAQPMDDWTIYRMEGNRLEELAGQDDDRVK